MPVMHSLIGEPPLPGPRVSLPTDSEQYRRSTVGLLRLHWASVRSDERRVAEVVEEIKAARIYEHWPSEQPYGTLDALCLAEIGVPATLVTRTIQEVRTTRIQALADSPATLLPHGGDRRSEDTVQEAEQPVVNRLKPEYGSTNANYLTARIARDHPAILQQMQAGEYASVRAAALAAGIVKQRVSVPLDVEAAAKVLRRHFTSEQLDALISILEGEA